MVCDFANAEDKAKFESDAEKLASSVSFDVLIAALMLKANSEDLALLGQIRPKVLSALVQRRFPGEHPALILSDEG